MHKFQTGTWVVVADSKHARLFHNIGEKHALRLKQADVIKPDVGDANDQGTTGDPAPEVVQGLIDEGAFVRQLAHRLNAAALKQEFEHLFLIADPSTLGEIRPQLHVETSKRMSGELAKTLTNSSLEDIEKALKAHA
jgi:protein required for attachment to host cells